MNMPRPWLHKIRPTVSCDLNRLHIGKRSCFRKAANRTGNGGSGGSRELFSANRCEPETEYFFLNRKCHEPEPELFLNPFLILDPDEGFLNQLSLARLFVFGMLLARTFVMSTCADSAQVDERGTGIRTVVKTKL